MAKKQYAVVVDTTVGGKFVKAGSIVVLEEKDGASYKGSLEPSKAQCDHYAEEYGAKPVDLTSAAEADTKSEPQK